MNWFLNAKHWQLFALIFGLPFFLQTIVIGEILTSIPIEGNLNPILFDLLMVPLFLGMGILWGWLWSIGVGLQSIIPEEHRMNIKRFKFLLIVPCAYLLFSLGMANVYNYSASPLEIKFFTVLLLLHLFSIFCTFYSFYFVAKALKTAELQRKVTWGDTLGAFILLSMYPLGIWRIQPKINTLMAESIPQTSKNPFEVLDDGVF